MKNPTTKIQKECDHEFQVVGKLKFPRSIVSGLPTQVIHHWVPKSVSSALRYDFDNGIPLTNGEHCRLHQSGDPEINNKILLVKGLDWSINLRAKGRLYHKVNMEMYRQVKERLETEKADLLSRL